MIILRHLLDFLRDKQYQQLLLTSVIILMLGSTAYHYIEGWKWLDCIYFSVITLTTIGYGDLSPQTDLGKIFTIFYIFIGLGMIISFVETVYTHFAKLTKDKKQ